MNVAAADLFSVRGKIALITGGATGIGKMMAQGFLTNGATVYIASRKLSECQRTAEELSEIGDCQAFQVDVADPESIRRLKQEVSDRVDRLDILVNNSGTGWAQPLEEYSVEGWDKVFDVNLRGTFLTVQAMLPLLSTAATFEDPARIINVGSVSGVDTYSAAGNFAYSFSKAGVHHLSRVLANNLASRYITVNALAPGPFPSVMMERSGMLDRVVSNLPLQRHGTAEDAAGAALFLASRAGAFVTGAVLPLDGGLMTNPVEK